MSYNFDFPHRGNLSRLRLRIQAGMCGGGFGWRVEGSCYRFQPAQSIAGGALRQRLYADNVRCDQQGLSQRRGHRSRDRSATALSQGDRQSQRQQRFHRARELFRDAGRGCRLTPPFSQRFRRIRAKLREYADRDGSQGCLGRRSQRRLRD